MKIYIAGKITGDPDYPTKFAWEACKIRKAGHIPLNPAVLPGGMEQADYMRICIAMIDCADAALFLEDWAQSEGAKVERAYCRKIGKRIVSEKEAGINGEL